MCSWRGRSDCDISNEEMFESKQMKREEKIVQRIWFYGFVWQMVLKHQLELSHFVIFTKKVQIE